VRQALRLWCFLGRLNDGVRFDEMFQRAKQGGRETQGIVICLWSNNLCVLFGDSCRYTLVSFVTGSRE
jgi:hypothetical protein